jgi:hypothetical protein
MEESLASEGGPGWKTWDISFEMDMVMRNVWFLFV